MGCPFIGETVNYAMEGSVFFSSRLARYGAIYKTHVLGAPTVRVVGAENVRQVLVGEASNVESMWPRSVLNLMGSRSVLSLKEEEHGAVKKIVAEILCSQEILATYMPHVQAVVDTHLSRWCEETASNGGLLGFPACQDLIFSMVMEMVLGVPMAHPCHKQLIRDMHQLVESFFCMPVSFPGSCMWKGLRARKSILQTTQKVLSEKQEAQQREEAEARHASNRPVVSMAERLKQFPCMCEDPQLFEDMIVLFLVTGVTTTASSACSSLLELGRNPEARTMIEAELKDLGLLDDVGSSFTYDVIQRMTYLPAFVKEVLRVHPPGGAIFRKAKNTLKIGGYQIPKDWTVMVSIRETQQTSCMFPQPESFLPERWLPLADSKEQEKLRYHYLPFGVGSKTCTGRHFAQLQLYVFLVQVVRKCRLRMMNPDPEMQYVPSTMPKDRLPMQIWLKET